MPIIPDRGDTARLLTPRPSLGHTDAPAASHAVAFGYSGFSARQDKEDVFPVSEWALGRSLDFWLIFCVSGYNKIKEQV